MLAGREGGGDRLGTWTGQRARLRLVCLEECALGTESQSCGSSVAGDVLIGKRRGLGVS